jgi:hypothetical protein
LTTNDDLVLGTAAVTRIARQSKGGGLVSPRIQLLLIVLGLVVLAALNASSPWGP